MIICKGCKWADFWEDNIYCTKLPFRGLKVPGDFGCLSGEKIEHPQEIEKIVTCKDCKSIKINQETGGTFFFRCWNQGTAGAFVSLDFSCAGGEKETKKTACDQLLLWLIAASQPFLKRPKGVPRSAAKELNRVHNECAEFLAEFIKTKEKG